jgi:uncharacterized protein YcnI
MKMRRSLMIGVTAACVVMPAAAHVTLETKEAPVGTFYKAVLRVPHGCDGSATTAIRVKIPEGLIDVKPIPKAGWKLATITGPYTKTYKYGHGAQLSEGVIEIAWSSGNLPDAFYDEFVFQAFIPEDQQPGHFLYFPVVQECEKGVNRWIDIPAEGISAHESSEPAPVLRLLPKR